METIEYAQKIANYTKRTLDLDNIILSDEYYYSCLPLCVIDAVFSISVTYTSTRNTVIRFCDYFGIDRISERRKLLDEYPTPEKQMSITEFLSIYQQMSITEMMNHVYKNRQRTSSRNGILKSEAVKLFSEALYKNGVNYFQDLEISDTKNSLYKEITSIPGQKSGISYGYFLMLSGNKNLIKCDRMVRAYLERIIGYKPNERDSKLLLEKSIKILNESFPELTLRELDYSIWTYQRNM